MKSILVAILAYNEEDTLEKAVYHVRGALEKSGREYEILIINDGSKDKTPEIAEKLCAKLKEVKAIHHPKNRGPGSGILTAIKENRKDIFTFYAADMQGDFEERLPYLELLDKDTDVLLGYRLSRPEYSIWRRLVSFIFIRLMKLLFKLPFRDFNFFYFYTKEVLEKTKPKSKGVFIAPEIMIQARDLGFRLKEVPGTCRPRLAGKASCGRISVILVTVSEMLSFFFRRLFRRSSIFILNLG